VGRQSVRRAQDLVRPGQRPARRQSPELLPPPARGASGQGKPASAGLPRRLDRMILRRVRNPSCVVKISIAANSKISWMAQVEANNSQEMANRHDAPNGSTYLPPR